MRGILLYSAVLAVLLLMGCSTEKVEPRRTTERISIPTFRYDAARDVVLVTANPALVSVPIDPQRYATALALLSGAGYTPTAGVRLADPEATLTDSTLTVNYRDSASLAQLSSAQAMAVMAVLEAWFWVPGVRAMSLRVNGEPVRVLGPLAMTQPLRPVYHTYVVQPDTGEIGYLVGAATPGNPTEAIASLRSRVISPLPVQRGFQPLLPADTTLTAAPERMEDGVLSVELSAIVPRQTHPRLAGLVMMLTQFPMVDAVRFTFGGKTVDEPFMRTNLNRAISPYDLLLPGVVAAIPTPEIVAAIRGTVQASLGRAPAAFGVARVWREWAFVTATPTADVAPKTFILRTQHPGFEVKAYGQDLPVTQVLQQGVPGEAIIAFRLPGWEALALMNEGQK